jgi:hypothetical protein
VARVSIFGQASMPLPCNFRQAAKALLMLGEEIPMSKYRRAVAHQASGVTAECSRDARARRADSSTSATCRLVCARSITSSTMPMARSCARTRRQSRARRSAVPPALAVRLGRHGELLAVQDVHSRARVHHRDLRVRPRQPSGGADRSRVHRDLGTTGGVPDDHRNPGDDRLGERVQQLGAVTDHTAPFLADARQVPGHIHDHQQRNPK